MRCKAISRIALTLAAMPLSAAAGDFWWRGDRSAVWSDTFTQFGAVLDSNFATNSLGNVESFALPGGADVVRFASTNAGNLDTNLGVFFSIFSLTTESSLTTNVSITGGILAVGGGGVVTNAPRALTINSPLTTFQPSLIVNTANALSNVVINSQLSGTMGMTKSGTGGLTLANTNSYTGGTHIVNGTVTAVGGTSLPSGRPLTLGDSINGSRPFLNMTAVSQSISSLTIYAPNAPVSVIDVGAGSLTVAGDLSLLDTANVSGNLWGVTIAGGTGARLNLGGGVRNFTLAGQRVSQTELVVQPVITNGGINLSANPSTLDGTPAGMVLSAPTANPYTGGTTVNAGVLTVNSSTTLGPGALAFNTTGSVASQVILKNDAQFLTSLSTGTVGASIPSLTLTGTSLKVDQAASTTFAGTINGSGSLTKTGAGILTLAQSNTYNGVTIIDAGVITAAAAHAIPSNSALVIGNPVSGGVARFSTGSFDHTLSSLTIYAPSSSTNSIDLGSGTLTLNGNIDLLDTLVFAGNRFSSTLAAAPGGTLDLGGGVRTFTLAGQHFGRRELILQPVIANGGINLTANPSTLNGDPAGMVLAATAPNTYTGGTTVNAGTLTVNSSTTLGPGPLVLNTTGNVESKVILNNSAQTITSLKTVSVGTATPVLSLVGTSLTVELSTSAVFAGVIEGTGSMTLTGTGAGYLVLGKTNTYTGPTHIVDGMVVASAANAIPSNSPLIIGDPLGSSTRSVFDTGGFAHTLSALTFYARRGTTFVHMGSGTLTLAGDVSVLDTADAAGDRLGVSIEAGSGAQLDLGGGIRSFTLAGQNVSQNELTISAAIINGGINLTANPSTFNGAAAGMVFTASAPNTYTGGTTVNAGTLTVHSGTTLGPAALVLNTTGNVESRVFLKNAAQTITSLSTETIGMVVPVVELNGTALTINQSDMTVFQGLIEGTGSITKLGAGTLALAAGQSATHQMTGLTIGGGAIDATDSNLVIDYAGNYIISVLISYLNSGTLTANGDFDGLPTFLAVSEAADLGLSSFNGIAVDETAVIAKYTYVGDANLDGQVDALDYERIDLAIGNSGVFGTAQGDLNYDGNVDALDYEQVDLNIGNGVGSPLAGVFIPEPSALGVMLLVPLLARRWRR
jgi:autotransporter-associated beta strand protein